jgi:hypothetical protein
VVVAAAVVAAVAVAPHRPALPRLVTVALALVPAAVAAVVEAAVAALLTTLPRSAAAK